MAVLKFFNHTQATSQATATSVAATTTNPLSEWTPAAINGIIFGFIGVVLGLPPAVFALRSMWKRKFLRTTSVRDAEDGIELRSSIRDEETRIPMSLDGASTGVRSEEIASGDHKQVESG